MITPSVVEQLTKARQRLRMLGEDCQRRPLAVANLAEYIWDIADEMLPAIAALAAEPMLPTGRWHPDCVLCDLAETMQIPYDQAHQIKATIGKVTDAEAR